MVLVSASMLSSDLSNLQNQSELLINYGIDTLHMDIMDGVYVNNLTFGYPVLKCLKNNLPHSKLDCHFMVHNPLKIIDNYLDLAHSISFHYDNNDSNTNIIIDKIKEKNIKVGLALRPKIPPENIQKYINKIDYILIMSVEPGFSGQKFIPESIDKIEKCRKLYPTLDIQVDGGVNINNYKDIINAGATMLVSGSTIFNATDKKEIIKILKN